MASDRVCIKVQPEGKAEDTYFFEQDQKILKNLRDKAAKDSNAEYCGGHAGHCFRCGTKSLAEIERGDVKIDICVNENCGAIHLDPGELEQIVEDVQAISFVRKAVSAVFKK